MLTRTLCFRCAILFSSLLPSVAFADGVIRDAVGARTTGRGGVNVAFADNGQTILDNPAGIVNIQGNGLREAGFDLLMTDLGYRDADNPGWVDAVDNPFPAGQLAWTRRLPVNANGNRFGYGFGVFSHAGFASEYTLNGPAPLFGPRHYKSIGALVRVLPAVAIGIGDRLSIGMNAGLAINHMELEGPHFLQGPNPFAGTPTLFDFQATGLGFSYGGGLQYRLTTDTMLGFNYQGQTRFELDGNTAVTIPGIGSSRFDSTLEIAWPASFAVGVQHQLKPCLKVGCDVTLFDWSDSFDAFGIQLTGPDDPVLQAVVGNQLPETFPLNWRDSVSIKLGAEREIGMGRVLRAGYVYHRNPIPDATLTPFLQATLEHAVSVGAGCQLLGNEIDVAYQYSFGGDRNVSASQLLGGDFSNSSVRTAAHWVSVSAIKRF